MSKPSYENMKVNWNHNLLAHKHHGEHKVSNKCAHLHASLAVCIPTHTLYVCRSARPPCAFPSLQKLHS